MQTSCFNLLSYEWSHTANQNWPDLDQLNGQNYFKHVINTDSGDGHISSFWSNQ
jgi:hypothetical protein